MPVTVIKTGNSTGIPHIGTVQNARNGKPVGRKNMVMLWRAVLHPLLVLVLMCLLLPALAQAQFTQQGPKLVGTDAVDPARQGFSVSLSADGNTAIVGGDMDNLDVGAVWVYTRSGGVWSQQGPKLVGTGAVGSAAQGLSVSLSADGNTAIVGGPGDNSSAGAAWVYTRSAGVWSQQAKLVGTGAVGGISEQGHSVSLSGDGNTAIVGGPLDNFPAGAAWVFTRSGGVWSQQGAKLVGTGAVGGGQQGFSVSLSGNGNTAVLGGPVDNSDAGAAWVFTRSGEVWSQQGPKLVGTGAIGVALQGFSISLSGDGKTAIVGGYLDDNRAGAAWVYAVESVPFSSLSAELAITGGRHRGFALDASFVLGASSNGISPLTEPVTLQVGPYSAMIPAGSFRQRKAGHKFRVYVFDGAISGAQLAVDILSLGSNAYQFDATARPVNLSGVHNPVPLTTAIGDDSGSTTVVAERER